MMRDNNEFTVTIGLNNWKKYGVKGKEIYKFLCNIINEGARNLGIQTEVSHNVKAKTIFANQDCYAFVDVGDLCVMSSGLKFSAATYAIKNGFFQLDCVININGKSDVKPYLKEQDEGGFESTCLESIVGRPLKVEEIVTAFKKAFNNVIGIYEKPLTDEENSQLIKLSREKYLSKEWTFKDGRRY